MFDSALALHLLQRWSDHSERYWHDLPGRPGHPGVGCYGTGYNHWGYHTNQRYAAAMAVLATHPQSPPETDRPRVLARSLAALRFSLASHVTGPLSCTDGTRWGHTWISPLGIERMMHGVHALEPHLTDEDRDALRRMLISEADWQTTSHERSGHKGVQADRWNHSRKNNPESNLWVGALLWRVAQMYPDHAHADDWCQAAHAFLINGVSVPGDAKCEQIVAGKPVRQRHVGASFFPNYGLDHHGYLNVGYMVICVSQAAICHFDLRARGLAVADSLHHHQADLWQVTRRMIFGDGRLARLGGDSRVRYAYCQEYLLPSLLYAADHLGDGHAMALADRQLDLIRREAEHDGDGGFYSKRLAWLADFSPYYYVRLESDRAAALSMALTYAPLVAAQVEPRDSFEFSATGGWIEPEHAAVLHRCPTRLASFAWRAYGLAQGICQPPDDGHLCEWLQNLGGSVTLVGEQAPDGEPPARKLHSASVASFDGGWVTAGCVIEGANLMLADGWRGSDAARHSLALAALPDGHTVVALELCRALDKRILARQLMGMCLNLPNDLYNDFRRRIITPSGDITLAAPVAEPQRLPLGHWANIDNRVGIVGLHGADALTVHRVSQRRGGRYRSLHVEQIGWPAITQPTWYDPGQIMLNVAWAVLSSADARQTRAFSADNAGQMIPFTGPELRGLRVIGLDARRYALLANLSDMAVDVDTNQVGLNSVIDMVNGQRIGRGSELGPFAATLWREG
ncbi:MAG: hypothetical protein WD042_09145 [Phycisphaeraceae bacterium]